MKRWRQRDLQGGNARRAGTLMATLTVNSAGGADYTTIQAAVDAADVSSEIQIIEIQNAASYVENVDISGVTGTGTVSNYVHLTATDGAYHGGDLGVPAPGSSRREPRIPS